MLEEPLGGRMYEIETSIKEMKMYYNQTRILLGLQLLKMKELYEEETFDGNKWFNEDDGTFNQFLASIQMNPRRANPLMWNAKYLEELDISPLMYPQLDGSVIALCKKNGTNPLDYVHLSYSDIKKQKKDD